MPEPEPYVAPAFGPEEIGRYGEVEFPRRMPEPWLVSLKHPWYTQVPVTTCAAAGAAAQAATSTRNRWMGPTRLGVLPLHAAQLHVRLHGQRRALDMQSGTRPTVTERAEASLLMWDPSIWTPGSDAGTACIGHWTGCTTVVNSLQESDGTSCGGRPANR